MINQTQSTKADEEDFEEAESDGDEPPKFVGGLEPVKEGGFNLEDD